MNSKSDVVTVENGDEMENFHHQASESSEKFPKSVKFILSNVCLDRFSNGGIFAILTLFLHQKLNYDKDEATALYHTTEFIQYLFTIIGAIIADAFLGVFKTIATMTLVFALGSSILATGSFEFPYLPNKFLSLLGLFILVSASGAMKTNQSVFGGNQFKLPEQERQVNRYFSMHYLITKSGLLAGQILFPIISKDFECFGDDHCYPVTFIIATVVMMCAFGVFMIGRFSYVHLDKTENMFMKMCACVVGAIHRKFCDKSENSKHHWLDYSEKVHGVNLVNDVKQVFKLIKILCTMPLFWAIFGQCNSRWVFQANKMDGDLGFYELKPDQMIVFTTIFSIVSIPLADYVIYPVIARIGIRSNLQKVTMGLSLSSVAFITAAIIEYVISEREQKVSMLWLIPQYFIIALSEVFLWISILSFSYAKAPENMKSVITSVLYLTTAAGSLIVIFVSGFKIFHSQIVEFLVFAFVMTINTFIFNLTAKNYESKTTTTENK